MEKFRLQKVISLEVTFDNLMLLVWYDTMGTIFFCLLCSGLLWRRTSDDAWIFLAIKSVSVLHILHEGMKIYQHVYYYDVTMRW